MFWLICECVIIVVKLLVLEILYEYKLEIKIDI